MATVGRSYHTYHTHRTVYRRLWRQTWPCWPSIAGILLIDLAATPLSLLGPIPVKIAVDTVLGSEPLPPFLDALLPDVVTRSPFTLLAVAAALVSSLVNAPLPPDAVFFGEVSLSGAIRPVSQTSARLKEAAKLGFTRAFLPESAQAESPSESRFTLNSNSSLANLVSDIAARGKGAKRPCPAMQDD